MAGALFLGLMSGTSMDAIDAALVRCEGGRVELLDSLAQPISHELREKIDTLSHPGENEIQRLGSLDRELAYAFADAARLLLLQAGREAATITAIGSHGQTVRHHPPSVSATPSEAFSLQLGDPNTIAEATGITTVADFRRRDIAAGGEGAPLVPAFHAEVFADPEITRAILNIGGIANISLLQRGDVSGFDTGPGNTLLDHWSLLRRGEAYDAGGSWAAEGRVNEALLGALLAQEYFAAPSPKSTGKETFNPGWLDSVLSTLDPIAPGDVQATLAELTAVSISNAIKACSAAVQEVYVCGGGAANTDLMRRLYKHLPNIYLGTTADLGVDPDWVEAAAFAWLAWRTLERLPGNRPDVTGARGPRVLGAIYPGG